MKFTLKSMMHFVLVSSFILWMAACGNPEEKARHAVQQLTESLDNFDPDRVPKLRGKVLKYGEFAVPAIVRTLAGKSGVVKSELIVILEKIGDPAIRKMAIMLETETESTQLEIIRAFEQLKNKESEKPLIRYLGNLDKSDARYFPLIKTLIQFGSEEGYIAIGFLLHKGETGQRIEVAQFLAELADKRTVPDLLDSLITEKDGRVKISVVEALGNIEDERAVALIENRGLNNSTSYLVRKASAIALKKITGSDYKYRDKNGQLVYPVN